MAPGFAVAFLHAALPTHWLPFVLTARVQRWSRLRTLAVVALAGTGHVLVTAALGFLVAWGGMTLNGRLGEMFPLIAGGALLVLGLYYVVRQLRGGQRGPHHLVGGRDHAHKHGDAGRGPHGGLLIASGRGFMELTLFETGVPPCFRLHFLDEEKRPAAPYAAASIGLEAGWPDGARQKFAFHEGDGYLESTAVVPEAREFRCILRLAHGNRFHAHEVDIVEDEHAQGGRTCEHRATLPPRRSDWAAIGSLFGLLSFSPCEGFIPVYVSGLPYGWSGFFLLTFVLSAGTVLGLIGLTWLTLAGIEKLKLTILETYETGILGGLLMLLGLAIIIS
jgi:hypothetical protein